MRKWETQTWSYLHSACRRGNYKKSPLPTLSQLIFAACQEMQRWTRKNLNNWINTVADQLQDHFANMDQNERKKRLDQLLGKDGLRWTCSICHSSFSRKVTAIDHIEEQHLKIPSYPCSYCSRLFISCALRRKHVFHEHRTENLLAKALISPEELT